MFNTVRMIAGGGFVAASSIDARDIVQRAHEIHNTSPTASAALGRVLAITSLLGGAIKIDGGSVTVRFNGDGVGGQVLAVAESGGDVRGYTQNPYADPERRADGKLDVGAYIGTLGSLTVIKDLRLKEPYVGTVEILGGEVAEDLASYFVESEQIPTAIAAGVLVAPDGSIAAAGAYIIQLMPGYDDSVADRLQNAVIAAGPITAMLAEGKSSADILNIVLDGMEPVVVEEYDAHYRCDCSRERVERALISAGADELHKMIAEDGGAEATCRFCDVIYSFTENDLETLLERAQDKS